jgi:hypothetical protein
MPEPEIPSTGTKEIPSPGNTLIFFILATTCFLMFTVFSINTVTDPVKMDEAKDNNVVNFVYILLVMTGSYFINIHTSKIMCDQSIEWNYVLVATVLPWLIIFILLYFMLKLFPGWVSPFSNTIGYMFVSMLGIEKILIDILNDNKDGQQLAPDLLKAINTINSNKSNFINQISIENLRSYKDFIEKMKESLLIKTAVDIDDKLFLQLYKLLTIKHVVGKVVWYILAGILISSISYNYIIGMSCEKSIEQIKKEFADLK